MKHLLFMVLIAGVCSAGSAAIAQANQQQDDSSAAASEEGSYEAALLIGSLLPNQISDVTEILGLGGVRGGMRVGPSSWAEATLMMGNGSGQGWENLGVDARMDIPIENLVALAYVGLDVTQFHGAATDSTFNFGGHVGGGIQAHLGGNFWTRADMKFGFNPGVSLMINLGLVWRFGDAGSGGGT